MRESRQIAAALTAALAALALSGGCRTIEEGGREVIRPLPAVSPAVAFTMMRDAPFLPLIDLRPEAEFHGAQGHLAGAHNLPREELDARRRELRGYRDATVLAYCAADECDEADVEQLLALGVSDVVLIRGGLAAWLAAGYGTVDRHVGPDDCSAPASVAALAGGGAIR